ncbi:MAG: FdtA/QdtA family cupin domain-containing protein [Lachnospiraceae bacterium]|nr:FdtA/QdtA family cupin domain-containing protein [Lachnospiraceae bacterium]
MKPVYIDFQEHGDWRGQLVALEENKNIPFAVKRVYFMYDTKEGVVRGKHAHRQLQQILFCVAGACTISLDDGKEKIAVRLEQPYRGLLIGPGIWREMYDFTPGAVLMVLASEYYDESDYIRDYDVFLDSIGEEK